MIGGNEAKRRYWRVAKLPRRLEKARRHIATMGCRRLASCMGTRVANLEQHEPRDDQEARGVFEVSGSIKWFDPSKGYGFIVPDGDRPDILLHVTCLRRGDFQTAYEGARVVCEAINQSKGLHAVRILVMDESTAIPRNEQNRDAANRLLWVKSGQRSSAFVPQPEVRNHVASTARPNLGPLGKRERLGSLELARSLPCKDLAARHCKLPRSDRQ